MWRKTSCENDSFYPVDYTLITIVMPFAGKVDCQVDTSNMDSIFK